MNSSVLTLPKIPPRPLKLQVSPRGRTEILNRRRKKSADIEHPPNHDLVPTSSQESTHLYTGNTSGLRRQPPRPIPREEPEQGKGLRHQKHYEGEGHETRILVNPFVVRKDLDNNTQPQTARKAMSACSISGKWDWLQSSGFEHFQILRP